MKSRVALTLALFLTLIAPATAATTTKYTLSNTSWTDLGAGPMLLGFSGVGVYAIADTTPSIPKSEGFTMIAGESAQVATSSHVWAMAKDSPGVLAYVGPYDAPSGTSSGGGVVQQGAVDATAAPWQIDTLATGNLINAIKGPIAAGTNVIGYISNDACSQGAKLGASISLTASGQVITAGGGGKKTYICSIDLISATAQNIALVEGTGTTCATNIFGLAGGTTAATGWNFAANGGLTKGSGIGTVVSPSADANAGTANTCLLLSSTGQTSGSITYVQQ